MIGALETLELLNTRGHDYANIADAICDRSERLGLKSVNVALSCLHDKDCFVLYGRGQLERDCHWTDIPKSNLYTNESGQQCAQVALDLTALDELELIQPRVHVWGIIDDRVKFEPEVLKNVLSEFCLKMVQRQRGSIRRAFIESKVGSDDIGTFCFRFLNEAMSSLLPCELMSVFALDKLSGDLRLRGQVPRRTDKRHLSDVSISPSSNSWVRRCFNSNSPMSEYSALPLTVGRTSEAQSTKVYSRVYWPVKLQFRARKTAYDRTTQPSFGVLRLSNPIGKFENSRARPFHCFDAFSIEFVAESMYNIISAYVDRDVEGFDKDLAFHAAKTPAAGCLRNLQLAAQFLFEPYEVGFISQRTGSVPPQFKLVKTGSFEREELIRALSNSYAFAFNIFAQIERANITEEIYASESQIVPRLFADVVQKAINLAPFFEVSHSSRKHWSDPPIMQINRIFASAILPPPVIGDGGTLTSVFNNILENSMKYRRRNCPVTVDIGWIDESEYIVVTVSDDGIGIPESDAERIFTRGTRSERAKQHSVRGNGLGLAYCRRVLRAYSGDIMAIPKDVGLTIEVKLKKATRYPRGGREYS